MFIQRPQLSTSPQMELIRILLYLGKMSEVVKTKTMNKYIKFCKFRVIFQTNNRLRNYFCFKNFVPETLWSSLISQSKNFKTSGCFPKNWYTS